MSESFELCTIPAGVTLTRADMNALMWLARYRAAHPEITNAHYDPRSRTLVSDSISPFASVSVGIGPLS